MSTLEEKQKRLLTGQVDLQTWIDEIAQYRDVSSLNRNMVVSLIDSVQVFENGSVQVNFIYDDEIKAIFEKSQEEFAK